MKRLLYIVVVFFAASSLWAKPGNNAAGTPHDPFRQQLGARVGTSARLGTLNASSSFNEPFTWNWQALFFQLYYYDYWFEFHLAYQPTMEPAYSSYDSIRDVHNVPGGAYAANDDDISDFSNVFFTGYPLRMLGVNLGITLGHMHNRIGWLQADKHDQGADPGEYLKLTYQAFYAGLTYRFLDRIRIGVNILLPYQLELRNYLPYNETGANYDGIELFEQGDLIPGFMVTLDVFIVSNLSLNIEYYFMYYNLSRTHYHSQVPLEFDTLGSSTSYLDHRISISIGYGFNL